MKSLLIILIILFTIIPTSIHAEEVQNNNKSSTLQSIALSPVIIEALLDPDEEVEKEVLVKNVTNLAIPLKILKESFTPKEKINMNPEELKAYDASAWVTLKDEDRDMILNPQASKVIKFKIKSPKNASPGGHYATLYFQPLIPEDSVSKDSIQVITRVAVLLFLQIKGDIIENLTINSMILNTLNESTPVNISLLLTNEGNTHLSPSGYIEIFDELSNLSITKLPIQPSILLPKTQRTFQMEFNNNVPIGRLSAKAVLTYGLNNSKLESEKNIFYIIPYKLLLIILIFIFCITFLRKRLKKSFKVLFSRPKKKIKIFY